MRQWNLLLIYFVDLLASFRVNVLSTHRNTIYSLNVYFACYTCLHSQLQVIKNSLRPWHDWDNPIVLFSVFSFSFDTFYSNTSHTHTHRYTVRCRAPEISPRKILSIWWFSMSNRRNNSYSGRSSTSQHHPIHHLNHIKTSFQTLKKMGFRMLPYFR